jgi:HEAT repeat protein
MRQLLLFLFIGLFLLVMLGVFLLPAWRDRSHVPGTDLSHFHPSVVPEHIETLKSTDAADRKKAAKILWQIGVAAREATPTLLQTAKDADPEVREAAVKALGRTSQETKDALPVLIEALNDDQAEVRAAAAISLAEVWRMGGKGRSAAGSARVGRPGEGRNNQGGNPRTIVPLIPSYEALAQKAVPLLTAALRDADARVRTHAAEALAEAGPLAEPAVSDLVQILQKDTGPDARLQATLALANIGPRAKAAVAVLVEKLRGEKADGVRVNTAVALGMIRSSPETVVPALVDTFLKDEHPDARLAAMGSLGQFGPEAKIAIPLLREAAKDPANQLAEGTMQNINRLLEFLARASAEDKGTR